MKIIHEPSNVEDAYPMDKLLARLSEQQAVLCQQNEALKLSDEDRREDRPYPRVLDFASASNSVPVTPATDAFPSTAPTTRSASASVEQTRAENDEVLRLKLQLAQAQNEITKLDQELAQTRTVKAEPDQPAFNSRTEIQNPREGTWGTPDDVQSDTSDVLSANTFNRARGIWGNPKSSFAGPAAEPSPANWLGNRNFTQGYPDSYATQFPVMDSYRGDRLTPDPDVLRSHAARRGNRYDSRFNSPQPFGNNYGGGFNSPAPRSEYMGAPMHNGPMNSPGPGPMGMGMFQSPYSQPAGTPLSPHASEFTSNAVWKNEVSQTLVSHESYH